LHPQALAINPLTFSPEWLLHAATVIRIEKGPSESTIVIKQFRRTDADGTNPMASSFGILGDEEEPEEETVSWKDVVENGWRELTF